MRFYGLLDHELAEVIEFYATQAEANAALAELLGDEPGWDSKLEIVRVDFGGARGSGERVQKRPELVSRGARYIAAQSEPRRGG